ncbi:hypothetical protein AZA_07430 [Nitrospirillum viridazoti Y2]|nr:hypothetical protein AZA_07430 [Nitrospirillum amazonense Y2]
MTGSQKGNGRPGDGGTRAALRSSAERALGGAQPGRDGGTGTLDHRADTVSNRTPAGKNKHANTSV